MHSRSLPSLTNAALLAVVAWGLAACNPVFAPPIRSVEYGAPARVAPGHGELMLGTNTLFTTNLHVGVSVTEDIAIEGSFDMPLLGVVEREDSWAIASTGFRWTPARPGAESHEGWAADVELGVGAGVGGAEGKSNARAWWQIPAGGMYVGGGGGFHADWISFFARARAQVVGAKDLPATVWLSSRIGVEVEFGPVPLMFSTGVSAYLNEKEVMWSPLADLTLGVTFDL